MGVTTAGPSLQELISTTLGAELDESAPLSAADLHTLLDRIQTRSGEIKDRVKKSLTKNHEKFLGLISNASEAITDVESIAQDLRQVLDALGEREKLESGNANHKARNRQSLNEIRERITFDLEVCELAGENERLRKEQEQRREYTKAVKFIVEVNEGLRNAEREFSKGKLIEAACDLFEIREELGLPADWTGDRDDEKEREQNKEKVKAFTLLEDEWAACYAKLQSFLEGLFSQAVIHNENKSELRVRSSVSCSNSSAGVEIAEVKLNTILSAMDNVGVLDTRLANTADKLFKNVLDPILEDPQLCLDSTKLSQEGQAILSVRSGQKTKNKRGSDMEVYTKLLEVFNFLRQNFLVKNNQWMLRFGRVVWPRLADSIIKNRLQKAIPIETSELAGFQELAKLTADFETSLGREGLIPDWDETKGDKLRKFSSDVEIHFAVKKRKRVLAKARDLLVQSNFNTYVIIEEEKTKKGSDENDNTSLLQTETCAITHPAKQLLELVHETLQDACNSNPHTALELYHAARESLLLYRSIVPVKLIMQLDRIHKVAALCHNDCIYLAHNLLFLKFQYRAALPSNVQEILSFVDLVPLFRKLGGDILEKQMHLIKVDLMAALDRANRFQLIDQKKYYNNADNAIHQAVIVLEAVHITWQSVLATTVHDVTMGLLVESVVSRLTTEVLAFEDISVEEGEQLRKLMLGALEILAPLFGPKSGEVEGGDSQPLHVTEKEKLVPTWRKLARLTDLLDMSLRPITQSWESGDLTLCGFCPEEVQKLIKAIFSDTPLRTECLKRIVSASQQEV